MILIEFNVYICYFSEGIWGRILTFAFELFLSDELGGFYETCGVISLAVSLLFKIVYLGDRYASF